MIKRLCKVYIRGFTLLEVMIALVIFSLSAIAFTVQLGASNQLRYSIMEREQALWLAKTELSYLARFEQARAELPRDKDFNIGGRDWLVASEKKDYNSYGVSKLTVRVFIARGDDKPIFTMARYVRSK